MCIQYQCKVHIIWILHIFDNLNKIKYVYIPPLGIFDQCVNQFKKWQDAIETKNQLHIESNLTNQILQLCSKFDLLTFSQLISHI